MMEKIRLVSMRRHGGEERGIILGFDLKLRYMKGRRR
jgi:hypothetical protein